MAERNLDFNTIINRKNTNSLKYDFAAERGRPKDVLPLWVADMDFRISSYIQDALLSQVEHGIYGYSEAKDGYFEAVHDWFLKHHNWEVQRSWLVKTPGVVMAIAMAIKAFTKEGEGVLIQQPVYYPFMEVVRANNRKLVNNPLIFDGSKYKIDFKDLEEKIKAEHVRLMVLCSPHNPVGRVWTKEELERLGDICEQYHVIVVSDEIHADFVYQGKHWVFPTVKKSFADFSIVCTAPSKTFNIAGLQVSNIWISNPALRRQFCKQLDAVGYSQLNGAGLVACEAAYRNGEAWYEAMIAYVKDNIAYTRTFLEEHIPEVQMIEPEGTYMVWLDFRGLNLTECELEELILQKAGLWLDSGSIFGEEGRNFQRINVACPRKTLETALIHLENAITTE